jgi:hypothetical protein
VQTRPVERINNDARAGLAKPSKLFESAGGAAFALSSRQSIMHIHRISKWARTRIERLGVGIALVMAPAVPSGTCTPPTDPNPPTTTPPPPATQDGGTNASGARDRALLPTVKLNGGGASSEAYWANGSLAAIDGALNWDVSWRSDATEQPAFTVKLEYLSGEPDDAKLGEDFAASNVIDVPAGSGNPGVPLPPLTVHPFEGSGTKRIRVRIKEDPCYKLPPGEPDEFTTITIMDTYHPQVGIVGSLESSDGLAQANDRPSPTDPRSYSSPIFSQANEPLLLIEGDPVDQTHLILIARDQVKFALNIRVEIKNGSAKCGPDFTSAFIACNRAFDVTFAPGERTVSLPLTASQDTEREHREDAEIVILPFDPSAAPNANANANANATPYRQWDDGRYVKFHRAIHIIDPNPPSPPPPPQPDGGADAGAPDSGLPNNSDGGPEDAGAGGDPQDAGTD